MLSTCAGGDALLTICLWKAGYAHTDPGFSFYHPTVRMFDPGPEDSPGLLYAMTEALSGRCDPSCQVTSLFLLLLVIGLSCWPCLTPQQALQPLLTIIFDKFCMDLLVFQRHVGHIGHT